MKQHIEDVLLLDDILREDFEERERALRQRSTDPGLVYKIKDDARVPATEPADLDDDVLDNVVVTGVLLDAVAGDIGRSQGEMREQILGLAKKQSDELTARIDELENRIAALESQIELMQQRGARNVALVRSGRDVA